MNPNTAPLQIEYRDADLNMYPYSDTVLPCSNLIIWVQDHALQNGEDLIYCLRDHQLPDVCIPDNATGTVIAISRNLLEIINSYTFLLFEKKLFSLYSPVTLTVDKKRQETLSTILQSIQDELTDASPGHSEALKVLLMLFLLRLSECSEITNASGDNRDESLFVRRYLDLVQTHFLEWKRVSDYANHLCVTPNYLNTKIKKITGFPAGHHIQQRIIFEAKRQARCHGLRTKEVAHYLGFDVAHFSKYFKNGTGINFSSYLKMDNVF